MTAPPASTEVPTPDPVREQPPGDRYCDLVLNGGVASGVVYPWAIIELARHYRFRNIGGNSVGAMAAALAAAAEYGRCQGYADAFEPLRRAPLEFAEEKDGRSGMLRLFQPGAKVRRLFALLLIFVEGGERGRAKAAIVWAALGLYGLRPWLLGVPLVVLAGWRELLRPYDAATLDNALDRASRVLYLWGLLGGGAAVALAVTVLVLLVVALPRLMADLHALMKHDWGLCSGRAQPPKAGGLPTEKALIEWLHEGIQRSAQRTRDDPPLTFADLWHAPRAGLPATDGPDPPAEKSIALEMFSTNVSLGRPVRWPLLDHNTRLFFKPDEWQRLFPPTLLNAVMAAAVRYVPQGGGDPQRERGSPAQRQLLDSVYEVPAGDLPIAVAARMSLSFPLLFTCVPVYAIDYERAQDQRELRRCWLTDGGICTNFPIHLFDAAHPRWPTFGLMLSRRLQDHGDSAVWLPERHLDGRADNWNGDVPGALPTFGFQRKPVQGLFDLLFGMVNTAREWSDNLTSRLPHVRNRVLRMALKPGEGQLNIAMPGSRILHMAHVYGTLGGQMLVDRYVPKASQPTVAWREHLYVRALMNLRALRRMLRGYRRAVGSAGHSVPIAKVLDGAREGRPLSVWPSQVPRDRTGAQLSDHQAAALQAAIDAVAALEQTLDQHDEALGPYQPLPPAELRLRSLV